MSAEWFIKEKDMARYEMRLKRILSAICFLISISFFLISGNQITGAAISSEFEFPFTSSVFGFVFLMIAVSLLAEERRDLEIITESEFRAKILLKNTDIRIIDTSILLAYSYEEIRKMLSSIDNLLVPKSVLSEIKDTRLKKLLEHKCEEDIADESDLKMAKNYLQKTEKAQLFDFLMPYIEEPQRIKHHKNQKRLMAEINAKTERIRKIMLEEGVDISLANEYPKIILNKIKEYLLHCRVSETDIDVLATAIHYANKGLKAQVVEKDIDLREAIKMIIKEHPKFKDYLDYTEPYAA